MRQTKGFSLIELMIVIAILGILASVATNSYRNYVIKSDRTEAQATLVKIADAQETYYLDNNQYATTAQLGNGYTNTTDAGWSFAIALTNGNQTFTATATRTDDTDCPTMTITSGSSLGTGSWNNDSSCD